MMFSLYILHNNERSETDAELFPIQEKFTQGFMNQLEVGEEKFLHLFN